MTVILSKKMHNKIIFMEGSDLTALPRPDHTLTVKLIEPVGRPITPNNSNKLYKSIIQIMETKG